MINTITDVTKFFTVGKKAVLSAANVSAPGIKNIVTTFLNKGIELMPASVTPGAGNVVVISNSIGPLFVKQSLTATLTFTDNGGVLELKIEITLSIPTGEFAYLSGIFPELDNTLFNELGFSSLTAVIDSQNPVTITQADFASSFSGDVKKQVSDSFGSLGVTSVDAIQITGKHTPNSGLAQILSGDILNGAKVPTINIAGKIGYDKKYGALLACFPLTVVTTTGKLFNLPALSFSAGISALPVIGKKYTNYWVPGSITGAFVGIAAEVSATFMNLAFMPVDLEFKYTLNHLDELIQIFDPSKKSAGIFPADFPSLPPSTEANLRTTLLLSDPTNPVYSLSAGMEFPLKWEAIPGFLVCDKFDFEVTLYISGTAITGYNVWADVTMMLLETVPFEGRVAFSGMHNETGFVSTSQSFTLDIEQGKKLNIGTLFSKLGIPVPAFNDLTCDRLAIGGDLITKSFSLDCHFATAGTGWNIDGLGLAIKGAGVKIWHYPDYNTITFDAEVAIGGNDIPIELGYNNGAYFITIDLNFASDLAAFLSKHTTLDKILPSNNAVLKSLSNVKIKTVQVSYTNATNLNLEIDAVDGSADMTLILQCANGVWDIQATVGAFKIVKNAPLSFCEYTDSTPKVFDATQMLTQLGAPAGLLDELPDIRLNVTGGFLAALDGPAVGGKGVVACLEVSEFFSLSEIPLIGEKLTGSLSGGVEITKLIYVSDGIDSTNYTNTIVPAFAALSKVPYAKGLSVEMKLTLGHEVETMTLSVDNSGAGKPAPALPAVQSQPAPPTGANSPPVALNDGIKWKAINKNLGPLFVQNLGVSLVNNNLEFGITGSVTIGPLTAELMGLTVSSPLHSFNPKFNLSGIALDINKPPLTIAGFLLKEQDPDGYIQFNGGLIIDTGQVSIDALGSFAYAKGKPPSLFVYGFLGLPMSGQPIVSVTGLAAGFGINRTFNLPPPEGVASFPLLAVAEDDGSGSLNMQQLMQLSSQMDKDFAIQDGTDWFALGMRLDILELIDGFVLVAPVMGKENALNIAGVFTLVAPSSDPRPLGEIQLAFIASYNFDSGVMQALGALTTNSWIIDTDARIRGDFYFITFLKEPPSSYPGSSKGAYVISAGGFGPYITPPQGTPAIKPLTLNWQVSDKLSVSASAYFAMVPHKFAAGGNLAINFQDGGSHFSVEATANFSAHFLIEWKPLYYTAHISVSIDLEVTVKLLFTKHVNLSASADLNVYGPPFSGYGEVKLHILFTFHVHVAWGQTVDTPSMDWNNFAKSFLPEESKASSITIKSGLIKTVNTADGTWWVVNPKNLLINVSGTVPSSAINITSNGSPFGKPVPTTSGVSVGVKPLSVAVGTLTTNTILDFSQLENGSTVAVANFPFDVIAVKQNLAGAVWGTNSADGLLHNCLVGLDFRIKPALTSSTADVNVNTDNLKFELFNGSATPRKALLNVAYTTDKTASKTTVPDAQLSSLLGIVAGTSVTVPLNLITTSINIITV